MAVVRGLVRSTARPLVRGLTDRSGATVNRPVITVPGAQTLLLSSAPLVFASSISVSDAVDTSLTMTLTFTGGTITLDGTTGLSFSVGDGTADETMTFSGTITNINNALSGMSVTAGSTGDRTLAIVATNSTGSRSANVAVQFGSVPANTVAPAISGNLRYGNVLTASDGTWTGYPTPTITKQWQNAGSSISGQTGNTYTSVAGDLSDAITCEVTGTNAYGSAMAETAAVTITEPLNITALTFTWSSDGTSEPHTADVGFVSGEMLVGDTVEFQIDTATTFNTGDLQEPTNTLDGSEIGAGAIDAGITGLANDTWYGRVRIKRVYHTDGSFEVSDWSGYDDLVVDVGASWTPDDLWLASEVGGWWDASVLASMKQSNAGSTDVASDADPVGYWLDQGPNAHAITSVADDTTRPAYKTSGGLHWVEFDGSNDVLRKASDVGIYGAGACTVMIAAKANPGTGKNLISEGNSGSSPPLYVPVRSSASTATTGTQYIRGDDSAVDQDFATSASFFDNTDDVLTVVDSGSAFTLYKDGTQVATAGYTRSPGATMNRFAVGALISTTTNSWFATRIYALIVIGRALDSTERAAATTWLGAKMGRTL